ncbi:hypothetical protein WJX73_009940 [Symbiochloris irregularis]|uniref:Uncharacterized protein n=1 Tax=Symbiochloris irregularis TaxID=706552 RepID=A0AAW1PR15_9CHLO
MNKTFCRARVLQSSDCTPESAAQLITDFLTRDLDVRQDIDRNLSKAAEGLREWAALPESLQPTAAPQAAPGTQATPLPEKQASPAPARQQAQGLQVLTETHSPKLQTTMPVEAANRASRLKKKKKKQKHQQITGNEKQAAAPANGCKATQPCYCDRQGAPAG